MWLKIVLKHADGKLPCSNQYRLPKAGTEMWLTPSLHAELWQFSPHALAFFMLSLSIVINITHRYKMDTNIYKMHSNTQIGKISVNTLRPGQNGRHFADDIFKCIFLNQNAWTPIKISLKCVPKGPINNIPALVQMMAWRRPGDKPLSEPMMFFLLTHIGVTRPQWVKPLLHAGIDLWYENELLELTFYNSSCRYNFEDPNK